MTKKINNWRERLVMFRKKYNLTQKALGELLMNTPRRTVQDWELEARTPPNYLILALERIAEQIKSKKGK